MGGVGMTGLWFALLAVALGLLVFGGLRVERSREVRRARVGDPCQVYVYPRRGGGIVYVGEGYDWRVRRRRHRKSWWWPLVASETPRVITCRNKAAAQRLEAQLIREHLPTGNTRGIPAHVLAARRAA